MSNDDRDHRVYRRFIDGQEVFLCRDCNIRAKRRRPKLSDAEVAAETVVPFGHGRLQ